MSSTRAVGVGHQTVGMFINHWDRAIGTHSTTRNTDISAGRWRTRILPNTPRIRVCGGFPRNGENRVTLRPETITAPPAPLKRFPGESGRMVGGLAGLYFDAPPITAGWLLSILPAANISGPTSP